MAQSLFARKPLGLLLAEAEEEGEGRLRRALGAVHLTALGMGSIIGAGIFVTTGAIARQTAGPALLLSYVVAGLACIFAALCYAEFASIVPVSGSAYTYTYATLGELFAWIMGWDLVLEYAGGAALVANGWSGYLQSVLSSFGITLPRAISGAVVRYDPGLGRLLPTGSLLNLPAVLIVALLLVVLIAGIRESARFNAVMVVVKLATVLFVIVVGAFHVDPRNWHPFAPYGMTGVVLFGKTLLGHTDPGGRPVGMLAGAALAFLAYLGFDAVSTQSEEARRPQRDVPIGIVASLFICTLLYMGVIAVLTGMVPYDKLDLNAPLANAFAQVGLPWAKLLIALAGVAGITTVLLVLLLALPRILLAMARDGLLPSGFFAAVHPRFRTPHKATLATGLLVGLVTAFLPIDVIVNLVNMGTLLAFVIVCAAIPVMRRTHPDAVRHFRVPFVPLIPILGVLSCLLLMCSLPAENWLRLGVWFAVGMAIYLLYGRRHSVLRRATPSKPVL
ncbi:MAG: basic amino acid/polyamine antiporter, family [Acidobacteriota bacterium]|nr:basic amino acid/polyamine antiporter, family [Acidobacteriota bacterium]